MQAQKWSEQVKLQQALNIEPEEQLPPPPAPSAPPTSQVGQKYPGSSAASKVGGKATTSTSKLGEKAPEVGKIRAKTAIPKVGEKLPSARNVEKKTSLPETLTPGQFSHPVGEKVSSVKQVGRHEKIKVQVLIALKPSYKHKN